MAGHSLLPAPLRDHGCAPHWEASAWSGGCPGLTCRPGGFPGAAPPQLPPRAALRGNSGLSPWPARPRGLPRNLFSFQSKSAHVTLGPTGSLSALERRRQGSVVVSNRQPQGGPQMCQNRKGGTHSPTLAVGRSHSHQVQGSPCSLAARGSPTPPGGRKVGSQAHWPRAQQGASPAFTSCPGVPSHRTPAHLLWRTWLCPPPLP